MALGGECLWLSLRQLQHNINGLQAAGVRFRRGEPDQFPVYSDTLLEAPQLAQHGLHAGLRYLQVRAAELLPHQHMELPLPGTAQSPQRLKDVFLLNRQQHVDHLPGGEPRLLR